MNALPPDFRGHNRPALAPDQRLAGRWAALAGAAQVVAGLARVSDAEPDLRAPYALDGVTGGRRVLIDQALEDLLAMMEPGLTALLAVHQHDGPTAPAAMALWQEFLRARRALVALAPLGTVAAS